LLEHSHLVQLFRNVYVSYISQPSASKNVDSRALLGPKTEGFSETELSNALELGQQLFKKLKKDSDICGANLKVFYTGWSPLVGPLVNDNDPTFKFLKFAIENKFFSSQGIDFYDLSITDPMLEVHKNKSFYSIPYDLHPNSFGAEQIAKATISVLR
jgi:hypothetical protein